MKLVSRVTKSNKTRSRLIYVRDKLCLTWDEIAEMPEFKGIPKQTLNQIYHGNRDVPKKYRVRLGEPETMQAPVCTVHRVVHCYDCAKETVKARRKPKEWKQPKRYSPGYAWMFEQMSKDWK